MKFNIMGNISTLTLLSEGEYIAYLAREVPKGADLLPLFKVLSTSKLRDSVLAVIFDPPYLTALVQNQSELECLGHDDYGFSPIAANTIAIGGYSEELAPQEIDLPSLVQFCLTIGMAGELGITESEEPEKASVLKQIESLKAEVDSAREINTLLIDLAKALAEEKGEQLQEQIIDKATAAMLNESAASQLAASTENDVADILDSSVGGVVEDDIYSEIYEQVKQLHVVDRLALCLCEPDTVLEDWVENQYGELPTVSSLSYIKLSCETLIGKMASAVKGRIYEAVEP